MGKLRAEGGKIGRKERGEGEGKGEGGCFFWNEWKKEFGFFGIGGKIQYVFCDFFGIIISAK